METKRLITRSDLDGLACAVLLQALGMVDDLKFVHPKDVQDGQVPITSDDITANLPYVETAYLAFDHHTSELLRTGERQAANRVIQADAPSTARVIFNHYGGEARFGTRYAELLAAADKADSAQFSRDEILNPQGWTLLAFLMDPRTGLGRFHDFRISNYNLMLELFRAAAELSIDELLALPDVQERVRLYFEQAEKFKAQLQARARVHGPVVVLDLRNQPVVYAGNRFIVYAQYPECRVSVHVMDGKQRQNTVLAVGKSIFNRSARIDVGALMLEYGGGGHTAAGTCQVANENSDRVLAEVIRRLSADA